MLCMRSSELTFLITKSLYPLNYILQFLSHPSPWQPPFGCLSLKFTFFFLKLAVLDLSCHVQGLVLLAGIELKLSALGVRSLNHWIIRKSPQN